MGRSLTRVHVLATWIVGAQLVAWTATGFAFTLFDFPVVRGEGDRAPAAPLALASVKLGPAEAAAGARASRPDGGDVHAVHLKTLDGRAVYEVALRNDTTRTSVLLDAESGSPLVIDGPTAGRLATRAFRGVASPLRVARQESAGAASFVVRLDDARETDVTIDVSTGDVTAWQNGSYRLFDTIWSIHVLGYIDNRSPAHWALRIAAFIASVATFSGASLLAARALRALRRRRAARLAPAPHAHEACAP